MIKKTLDFINKNKMWIFCILFLLIFIFIAEDLLDNSISNLDDSIYKILIEPLRNDTNTKIFKGITNMASSVALLGICVLSFIIFKNKKYSILTVINLGNVVVLNMVLKNIFSRPRPEELMLISETGYSFPSGHSMASMAFYGFLIYLIWQTKWEKGIKLFLSLCLGTVIVLVGISRLYLGVHYASDVIAGFSISLVYLIIFTKLISKYLLKNIKGNNEMKI